MAKNKGKEFEEEFRKDFKKSFPNSFLLRLPDQQSQYYGGSSNPCDFITYADDKLFLVECKSCLGNTFSFTNLRQYDKLKDYRNLPGVHACVILWMIDHDEVLYIPICAVTACKQDNLKSFNVKTTDRNKYEIINVPSIKKRTFMASDYTFLKQLPEDITIEEKINKNREGS